MSDRTVVITMTEENVKAFVASYKEDPGCIEEFIAQLETEIGAECSVTDYPETEDITVTYNVRIDGVSSDFTMTTLEA